MLTRKYTTIIALLAFLIIAGISTAGWAATYYVATTGSNGNPGTISAPFATIQYAINLLQAGDTCMIRGGVYNEALVLKQSGTSTAPITIRNYNSETVTVNSGNSKALRTGGRRHYCTIDGLRFVSNHVSYASGNDYTLDFGDGVWDGNNVPTGGNNGFIVRNCYIEGAIYFYGHNNLAENCQLNGKSLWGNGLHDAFGSSYNNTFRKNTVYGFKSRGIWSMSYTRGVVIEDNTVYNITTMGIDCDGAGHPVYNSIVRRNTVYNVGGRGIEMENAFNSVVEKNTVHHVDIGIHYINYGNGPDFTSDGEYRNVPTNGIVRNNLVYSTLTSGILLRAAPSIKVYNNTVYGNGSTNNYYGGIGLIKYGGYFPANADIRNNILVENRPYPVWIENTAAGIAGIVQMSNNDYYNSTNTKTHYFSAASQSLTLSGFITATNKELNSFFSNPNFVNSSLYDFHLLGTSPAINAGAPLTGVTDDIVGNLRGQRYDLGAYAFKTPPAYPGNPHFAP